MVVIVPCILDQTRVRIGTPDSIRVLSGVLLLRYAMGKSNERLRMLGVVYPSIRGV
jgi:hypothetical protein